MEHRDFIKQQQSRTYQRQSKSKDGDKRSLYFNRMARTYFGDVIAEFKKERQKELTKRTLHRSYLKMKRNKRLYRRNQKQSTALQKIKRNSPLHNNLSWVLENWNRNQYYVNPVTGYAQTSINCKTYLVHRLVFMEYHRQFIAEGLEIGHINNNKLDNRIENLELLTHRQNILNAVRDGLTNKGSKDALWLEIYNFHMSQGSSHKRSYQLTMTKFNKSHAYVNMAIHQAKILLRKPK